MNPKPQVIRAATGLLWAAVLLQIASTIPDFISVKGGGGVQAVPLAADIVFVGISAAATYFFGLGRAWARTAILVLLIMGVIGMVLAFQVMFRESPWLGWMAIIHLTAQGAALYLGYSQPGASYFPSAPANDAAMRAILPVGRSSWAIAAGYLALFSVLVIPAPLALFCGLMAIRDIRRNPAKHGMGRAIFGVVMGSIVILIGLGLFLFRHK